MTRYRLTEKTRLWSSHFVIVLHNIRFVTLQVYVIVYAYTIEQKVKSIPTRFSPFYFSLQLFRF